MNDPTKQPPEPEERTIELPTGCTVTVDESRSLVELPVPKADGDCGENGLRRASETSNATSDDQSDGHLTGWKAISPAIWNGGLRSFGDGDGGSSSKAARKSASSTTIKPIDGDDQKDAQRRVCVFNYKVPSTYDGLDPEPTALIRNAIRASYDASASSTGCHETATVGIMTAASMKSLRTATFSAGGVVVDAIVTAGISNARAAGADADFFGILPSHVAGTINTVVVVNGCSLTEEAMIEAHAIAVEAKCGACADYSVDCAKAPGKLAQGTGTDCTVLLCPSSGSGSKGQPVAYAGKHCLLAELTGKAVREATGAAILSNYEYFYGTSSLWMWTKVHGHRLYRATESLICHGARPCVPAKPMDPVPSAPASVVGLGLVLVGGSYGLLACGVLPRSATVLLAATAWDRCLPEPPLSVHPVVLAGTAISLATKRYFPEKVFSTDRPLLGFGCGLAFSASTIVLFGAGGHGYLAALRYAERAAAVATASGNGWWIPPGAATHAAAWVGEVVLFKTTFSLQLLCTIALQMAGFLERSRLTEARAQLSWLCSRDPTHLDAEELAGGTLESLSENLSDGTVAPWFWYVCGGPVGALGYRVANTLDSRIGYRGGRYEWFGKAAARFDDLINWIPARLTTALLLGAASWLEGIASAQRGWTIALADRSQCASPNAGWPMAATAGILGVRLEKTGEYALGISNPDARGPTPSDIRKGHGIAQLAGGMALVLAVAVCTVREAATAK